MKEQIIDDILIICHVFMTFLSVNVYGLFPTRAH